MSYAVVMKSFGAIPPGMHAQRGIARWNAAVKSFGSIPLAVPADQTEQDPQEETTPLPDFEPDPISWEENTAQSIPEQQAATTVPVTSGGSSQIQTSTAQPKTASSSGFALAGLLVIGVVGYLWLT